MDRFVTRAPTWKTMNYSNVASSGYGRVNVVTKATAPTIPKLDKDTRKKPLTAVQEKSIDTLNDAIKGKKHGAFSTANEGRRLSILDERLLKIFSSQPDQPLIDPLASDSGCSSSSDSFHCSGSKHGDENTPPVGAENNNLYFKDISTDGIKAMENLQVSEVLLIPDVDGNPATPPQLALLATELPLPNIPKDNPLIMRIQRDLNSPSALARFRALKALKSPTKSAYSQFDVPHDEQSIITTEDRQATPTPPPSIQELMQNIIVYVEVRTGEDNRSAGVKKVISALGAKVNDKLLRDTTHVIFKDGLLSTYKKAKAWNIPVVSILWIEACKNQRKICDPFEFPISNIDRYENPELYEKMKRHKSMQPDSEANKRVRVKPSTPKDKPNTMTPKAGAFTKTSTMIGDSLSSANNKKTDISRFFQQLGSHKNVDAPETPTIEYIDYPTESPATQFLNKINSHFYNNNTSQLSVTEENKESQNRLLCIPNIHHVKKTLNFVAESMLATPPPAKTTIRGTQTQRTTTMIQMSATIEATTNSIEEMSLSQTPKKSTNVTNRNEKMMTPQTPNKKSNFDEDMSFVQTPRRKSVVKISRTPSRYSTRRRTMHNCVTINASPPQNPQETNTKATKPHYEVNTTQQEAPTTDLNKSTSSTTPKSKKTVRNRRTISTTKSLQSTPTPKDIAKLILNHRAEEVLKETDKKAKDIKQHHAKLSSESEPANVEMERDKVNDLIKTKTSSNLISNKRRTLFTPQSSIESFSDDCLEVKAITNAAKCLPSATKILPSVTKSLPNAAKYLPLNNKCNTIYGGDMQTTSNMTNFKDSATPIPVACSTLIDQKNDGIDKPTATPPQLIGSLLEEHANATVFSSTRNPGRRRTLFDVSMDIITQRLQNINQSSATRRSMERPSNYDLDIRRNSLERETPLQQSPVFNSMPNIPMANARKELFTVPSANTTKAVENELTNDTPSTESTQIPVVKKKRKLFVPNESPMQQTLVPTPPTPSASKNNVNTTPRSNVKRRRTLMPLAQPQSDIKSISSATTQPLESATTIVNNGKQVEKSGNVATAKSTSAPRRSTLDFEAATKLKVCTTTGAKKIVLTSNKVPTATKIVADACKNKKSKSENAVAQQSGINKSKYWPNTPYLVYTNMHKEQIEIIKQAVAKLGSFILENSVSDETTHVVSMEPRRTLNLLRALSRGLWILEFPWIEDSLRAGVWLSEEQYEMKDFSRAVEICRAERQAFGRDYRSELFTGLGSFYLPTRCGPLQKEDLTELIELCGGKITSQRRRAKYILGDANRVLEDKSYITPFWILDSITQMQLQKLNKYVAVPVDNACTNVVTSATGSQSSSQQQQSSQSNSPRTQCVIHDIKKK